MKYILKEVSLYFLLPMFFIMLIFNISNNFKENKANEDYSEIEYIDEEF